MMRYEIGGHRVDIENRSHWQLDSLLPSFRPFAVNEEDKATDSEPLFCLTLTDEPLTPRRTGERRFVHEIDTGNEILARIETFPDGGYFLSFRDTKGNPCGELEIYDTASRDIRAALFRDSLFPSALLNCMLLLTYAVRGAYFSTLLIHASVVRHKGLAYAFTAASGTGKSTHVALWMCHIPDCDILNDDNPILRLIDGEPYLYGSPWSGKTPCYRQRRARLGAVMLIERDKENRAEDEPPLKAFSTFITACSSLIWDKPSYSRYCQTITRLIPLIHVGTIHCRPDAEAARVALAYVTKPIKD